MKNTFFINFSKHFFLFFVFLQIPVSIPRYWVRPEYIQGDVSTSFSKLTVRPDPLGTVFIIGAWNFPFGLCLQPLVSAIAAGCTAVIKPSEVALNTCRLIKELIPRYLDKEAYPVIFADGPETSNILKKHRFDLVFFTGSPKIGRLVYQDWFYS
jgi:aldehyde dehydrogenase (NAD+)